MVKLVSDKFEPTKAKKLHEYVDKPNITPVDYKSAIVDNKEERLDTLVQYADGAAQKVTYFRQRLGEDETVSQFSMDLSTSSQQYERIDGFEILIQGSITSSQNTSENRFTEITCEAYVRQPVIPNVGDVVLMDFGRSTLGWFAVSSVRRLTHRRNTIYEVQLTLQYEIVDQEHDPKLIQLNNKVVAVYKYSTDYLKAGQNPLLTPKQAAVFTNLHEEYFRLLKYWFRKYYNKYYETCFLPNQERLIYDGFYMRKVREWFSLSKAPELIHFRIYSDEEFPLLKTTSVWDAITEQDKDLLAESFSEAVGVTVDAFTNVPQFAMIRYSGFQAVIAPHQHTYTNDIWIKNDWIIGKSFAPIVSVNERDYSVYQDIPLINQVIPSRSYVFSKDFYLNQVEGQSHLELQIHQYLNKSTLQMDVIEELVKDVKNWSELEQYYYIPVLLVLIHYGVRRMNG